MILAILSPQHTWLIIALIAAWMVLMCLKTLGHDYCSAVCWHNLKVEAHDLRIRHENELREMKNRALHKAAKKRDIGGEGHREESGTEDAPSTMGEAGDVSDRPAQAA